MAITQLKRKSSDNLSRTSKIFKATEEPIEIARQLFMFKSNYKADEKAKISVTPKSKDEFYSKYKVIFDKLEKKYPNRIEIDLVARRIRNVKSTGNYSQVNCDVERLMRTFEYSEDVVYSNTELPNNPSCTKPFEQSKVSSCSEQKLINTLAGMVVGLNEDLRGSKAFTELIKEPSTKRTLTLLPTSATRLPTSDDSKNILEESGPSREYFDPHSYRIRRLFALLRPILNPALARFTKKVFRHLKFLSEWQEVFPDFVNLSYWEQRAANVATIVDCKTLLKQLEERIKVLRLDPFYVFSNDDDYESD